LVDNVLRKCNCIGGNNTKINNGGKLKYFVRSSGVAVETPASMPAG
jgi:hypothetical protein